MTAAYFILGPFFALMAYDAVTYYWHQWVDRRATRAAAAWDAEIDQAIALCDPDAPIFAATVAAMPQVRARSVVDEAEAILRSAGGAR